MTMKTYTYQKLDLPDLVGPLIDEWRLRHRDSFYNISRVRERMSRALSKTRTYHLRSPILTGVTVTRTESTQDIIACADNKLYAQFPIMRSMLMKIGQELFGKWTTMGRVFVTRLDPNEAIGRHVDEGRYFDTLHRFHITLETAGSSFCWDDKRVALAQSELWMVNNSVPHWVENPTAKWRTHLIFDGA